MTPSYWEYTRTNEGCYTKSRHQGQGHVITSHSICGMWLLVPAFDTCFCYNTPHIGVVITRSVIARYRTQRGYVFLMSPLTINQHCGICEVDLLHIYDRVCYIMCDTYDIWSDQHLVVTRNKLASVLQVTFHYCDVIMGTMASQITSLTIVYSTVYSGADQRKHQSSASLAFVWGIHRGPVNSPHKWPVTRKMFPFDEVKMPRHFEMYLTDNNFLYIDTNTQNVKVTMCYQCSDNIVIITGVVDIQKIRFCALFYHSHKDFTHIRHIYSTMEYQGWF